MACQRWNIDEDTILRNHKGPLKLLKDLLPNRSWEAIRSRRQDLALNKSIGSSSPWSPEEDNIVIQLYPDFEAIRITLPHRTKSAIKSRAGGVLQLTRKTHGWLTKEIKVIRTDDGRSTAKELQIELKRHTIRAIAAERLRLGVSFRTRLQPASNDLMGDVAKRLAIVGMGKRELGRRVLSHPPGLRNFTQKQWADATALLGGELYAEWED